MFRWGNHHTFKVWIFNGFIALFSFVFRGQKIILLDVWFHTHNKIINIDGIRNELFWHIVHGAPIEVTKNSLFTCRFFFRIHSLTLSHQDIFNLLIVILVRWCEAKHFKIVTKQLYVPVSTHGMHIFASKNSRCKWSLLDVVNGSDVIEKKNWLKWFQHFFLLLRLCAWVDRARRAKCSTRSKGRYHNYRSSMHLFLGGGIHVSVFFYS